MLFSSNSYAKILIWPSVLSVTGWIICDAFWLPWYPRYFIVGASSCEVSYLCSAHDLSHVVWIMCKPAYPGEYSLEIINVQGRDPLSIIFMIWEPPSKSVLGTVWNLVEPAKLILDTVVEVSLFDSLDAVSEAVCYNPPKSIQQPF